MFRSINSRLFFSLRGVDRPGLRKHYGFHLDRSGVRIQDGFDQQCVLMIHRPPAKREGATDQLPVTSNRHIVTDLMFGPTQRTFDLFVALFDPECV